MDCARNKLELKMAKETKKHNLGFVTIPINQLIEADWNYKNDDPEKEIKLLENIKRNGQLENIIVRELETGFYEVVNGNHRLRVFNQLQYDSIFCFNLGVISVAAAERIAIETNETKFQTDTVRMAQVLNEIIQEYGIEDVEATMPFNHAELEAFQKLLDFNPNDFGESGSDGNPASPKITVECSHENLPELKAEIERIAIQFPGTTVK